MSFLPVERMLLGDAPNVALDWFRTSCVKNTETVHAGGRSLHYAEFWKVSVLYYFSTHW